MRMDGYPFGHQLFLMRKAARLSQAQLAEALFVTEKNVADWESGLAKPSMEKLSRISAYFGVSVEELLHGCDGAAAKSITKIVITGGPCAGKSTAMSWIQNAFTQKDYVVLFVPETATELITGGVAPWTCGCNEDYQKCQMRLQIAKEEIFQQAAESMDAEKILIVCDRGAIDNRVYMSQAEFARVLRSVGKSEVELRDGYDAVFHLTTAAKGAREFYTTANNSSRTETPEQAVERDDKLLVAWTGHPHLRVIDNSRSFEDKMKKLLAEISSFLGEPEPLEIERKFLIAYPDIAWLENNPNCRRIEIIQTYLKSPNGEEMRVRQRGSDGNFVYSITTKRAITGLKRVEIERRLTKEEYLTLLVEADTSMRPIHKTRYCLIYQGQYFEIDVYAFWQDKAIVELEVSDANTQIVFPEQLKVIREVTDDPEYKNVNLAKL